MKVRAVKWSSVVDKEINRRRYIGEEWEVSKERFEQLKACDEIEVEEVIENAKKEVKTKKAIKKSTK